MDRGTYVAASSGLANLRKLEIVNNNLANINTPGFKKQILVMDSQDFEETIAKEFAKIDPFAKGDHQRAPGITNIRAVTDFSPGSVKYTGNPLDAAIKKQNQFFVVSTPEGEQYTRAGNFTLNTEGQLVTPDGMTVMGDGGPITTEGAGVRITNSGSVLSGTQEFGRLRVVEFSDTQGLQPTGGCRYKFSGPVPPVPVEADVEASSLEMANVSAITSMVDMITANRGFEVYTRTAQSIDQLNQAAISQVGRSR